MKEIGSEDSVSQLSKTSILLSEEYDKELHKKEQKLKKSKGKLQIQFYSVKNYNSTHEHKPLKLITQESPKEKTH